MSFYILATFLATRHFRHQMRVVFASIRRGLLRVKAWIRGSIFVWNQACGQLWISICNLLRRTVRWVNPQIVGLVVLAWRRRHKQIQIIRRLFKAAILSAINLLEMNVVGVGCHDATVLVLRSKWLRLFERSCLLLLVDHLNLIGRIGHQGSIANLNWSTQIVLPISTEVFSVSVAKTRRLVLEKDWLGNERI